MLGVIVFAHGSRDPLWRAPVETVVRSIRAADPSVLVEPAYLELCEPDLASAAVRVATASMGARHCGSREPWAKRMRPRCGAVAMCRYLLRTSQPKVVSQITM